MIPDEIDCSHASFCRIPDELVHLKLEADGQIVGDHPLDDLPRLDSAKDRREENAAATLREVVRDTLSRDHS